MRLSLSARAALPAALLAFAVAGSPATAEDYFSGKVIKFTVGGSAAGGFTLAARILARHMGKHIPGNPTMVVQAMPGAGGARMMAWLYNAAPKDGTALGAVLPFAVVAPLLRKVKFDSAAFNWIGSITPMSEVSSVWHTSPAKTLEEAKKISIVMGTSSKLSSAYYIPAYMNALIGTKFTFVQGYRGGAPMNNAMEVGEINGRGSFYNSYLSTKMDWVRDKKIIHILQIGPPIKGLDNVPNLRDFAKTERDKQIVRFLEVPAEVGHGFCAPPGVPKDRVAMLQKAFAATMTDPGYLAEAGKTAQVINPVTGDKLQEIVDQAMKTPKSVIAEFRKMVKLDVKGDIRSAPKKKK